MASGILGTPTDLSADTTVTVYTVPDETFTMASISFCNRSDSNALIRLAVSRSDTPQPADYIEYDASIGANDILERTGLILNASDKLVVSSNIDSVNVFAYGIETSSL